MNFGSTEEAPSHPEQAPESTPTAPDSGRRPRPREQLATLPSDMDFEHHDTIPAPPWLDEPVESSSSTL